MIDIDETLESPAFWILGGGGILAEVMGYIASKKMNLTLMPLWQLIILIFTTLVAASFFATKE